jgi:hypothetical protein
MDPFLAKVLPEGRKVTHFDGVSTWVLVSFILRMRRNSFDKNSLVAVSYPQHGPDFTPADFWLFGHIKASFTSPVFNDVNALPEAVIESLHEIHPSELQFAFHRWIESAEWVLSNNAYYYNDQTTYPQWTRSDPLWRTTVAADESPYTPRRLHPDRVRRQPRRRASILQEVQAPRRAHGNVRRRTHRTCSNPAQAAA